MWSAETTGRMTRPTPPRTRSSRWRSWRARPKRAPRAVIRPGCGPRARRSPSSRRGSSKPESQQRPPRDLVEVGPHRRARRHLAIAQQAPEDARALVEVDGEDGVRRVAGEGGAERAVNDDPGVDVAAARCPHQLDRGRAAARTARGGREPDLPAVVAARQQQASPGQRPPPGLAVGVELRPEAAARRHPRVSTRAEPSIIPPDVTAQTSWRGTWRAPPRPWIW